MQRSLTIILDLLTHPLLSSCLFLSFGLGLLFALQSCRQVDRTLGTGETAVFDIHLEAGQFQAIFLEQQDGDLIMTLVSPTGETHEANYFYGTNVEEKLFWKANSAGTHKLMVTPRSKKDGFSLHYKLTIEPPRQPTPQDLDRLEAQRLYAEATRLVDTVQSNDREREQNHDHAAKMYEESARKWRAAGESSLSIVTLIRLGQSFHHNDAERAKSYYEQALQEALRSMNIRGQAEAYCNLGLAYHGLSKTWDVKQQSRQLLDEALKLSLQARDRKVEASTLSNLGMHYLSIGEYQPAAEHFRRAVGSMQQLGDQPEEAVVLVNLGVAYLYLGLKTEAENAYREALQIADRLGDKLQQARAYNGLGKVINEFGDGTLASKLEARENFMQAVSRGGRSRNQQVFEQNLGTVCNELGDMYTRLEEMDKARENFDQALAHLRESLRLQQEQGAGKVHQTLTSLGLLYHSLGQPDEAGRSLQEALNMSRQGRDEYQEATVLAALARIARDRNNLTEAKARIDEALKLVELLGLRIQVPEWRSSYATSQQYLYDLQIDILARLYSQGRHRQPSGSYHKVAWQQTERSRRNTLQEVLDTMRVSFSNGVDPNLIEEQKEVRASILQSKAPQHLTNPLSTRYREIERQIRQQNPRYDKLLYLDISPERLTDLQKKALKEDTILLEYALGQDQSYLWAITSTSFELFTLPMRIQLESAALEVYRAMTGVEWTDTLGNKQPENDQERRARFKKSELEYQKVSTRLSNMLLGPVAARLGKKKLLIVGDGVLGRIPFGALPVPMQDTNAGFRLLLQDHEIAYAPSAMTLLALQSELEAAKKEAGAAVIIADPVFNSKHRQASSCMDRRYSSNTSSAVLASPADTLANELSSVSFDDAERTKLCEAVFGQSPAGLRKELFGFQARRENVIDDRLIQFNNIIIYTHGILDEGGRGLSGLALSRLNRECESQAYLLNLDDIYNLRLSADLVTLIACNTARNQRMRGFGIGSIAHGFMFAGASHVIGTLWDVDGPASLNLITRFYRNRRHGESVSEALRAAQLSFLNDSHNDCRLPYYWAGFVLIGNFD
jgi:CHAT domain-containing protein/Tfp pilus assembly protein PilF